MLDRRTRLLVVLSLLCAGLYGVAAGYNEDEVSAILLARPESPPEEMGRIVLAMQRSITIRGDGSFTSVDHTLDFIGPASAGTEYRMRWTIRPGIEIAHAVKILVHHADGSTDPIPPETARTEPCAAGGPEGYPDLADYAVVIPNPRSGDVVETRIEGAARSLFRGFQSCGEYCFADRDSVVESELTLIVPSVLEFRSIRYGDLPPPRERSLGSSVEVRWLTGHIPPTADVARSPGFRLSPVPPDSLAPPTLQWAFSTDWTAALRARRSYWRYIFRQQGREIADVASRIMVEDIEPDRRLRAAAAWVSENLREIDIPVTRIWFEPAPLDPVVEGRKAIPRDQALALVWILRRMGLSADVASARLRSPILEEAVFPQQFDTWLVLCRVGGSENWIPFGWATAADSLPPGPAYMWTAGDEESPLTHFPGKKSD